MGVGEIETVTVTVRRGLPGLSVTEVAVEIRRERWIEKEIEIGTEAVEIEREARGTGRRIKTEKEKGVRGTKIRIERRRRRIEKGTGRKSEKERRGKGKGRRKENVPEGAAVTPGLNESVRRNCSEKKKENSNQGKAGEQVFFS